MNNDKELTPKQKRFVAEYLIDLNATQAAIRAGYSENTAQEQSSRLLSNVMVQAAVNEAQKSLSKKTETSQEWVIANLKQIVERCMQAEPILDKEGNITEWAFQHGGANRALELIGRHLGMFNDRLELNNSMAFKAELESAKELARKCMLQRSDNNLENLY